MHKKRLATGLRLGPQGEHTALPQTPISSSKEGEGKEGREGTNGVRGVIIPLPPTPGCAAVRQNTRFCLVRLRFPAVQLHITSHEQAEKSAV